MNQGGILNPLARMRHHFLMKRDKTQLGQRLLCTHFDLHEIAASFCQHSDALIGHIGSSDYIDFSKFVMPCHAVNQNLIRNIRAPRHIELIKALGVAQKVGPIICIKFISRNSQYAPKHAKITPSTTTQT
jgi:hypothetical protein